MNPPIPEFGREVILVMFQEQKLLQMLLNREISVLQYAKFSQRQIEALQKILDESKTNNHD